jgi:hypothetical protein
MMIKMVEGLDLKMGKSMKSLEGISPTRGLPQTVEGTKG